jgi:hypothetical protein
MTETTITNYAAAGALSTATGIARLTSAIDAAYTLADASGLTTDGLQKDIVNESAAGYHTVTGNFVNGNQPATRLIIAPGGNVRLLATGNGSWRVMNANHATVI